MSEAPIGQRVRLKAFNGTATAPEGCKPQENYWSLIGWVGEIVVPSNETHRVLVKFEEPVSLAGLHCHNEVENSLFILESDLEHLK